MYYDKLVIKQKKKLTHYLTLSSVYSRFTHVLVAYVPMLTLIFRQHSRFHFKIFDLAPNKDFWDQ